MLGAATAAALLLDRGATAPADALAAAGVDAAGPEVYARACAECHGVRGGGVERFGPELHAEQLRERFATAEDQLAYVMAGGDGGMPRFAGRLDALSVLAAVELTRAGLDLLGPVPVDPALDGGALFAAACATCHGAEGEGDVGPRLAGGAAVQRFPDLEDQIDWVTYGGADMPGFLTSLTTAQIRAVVEFTRTEL